MNVRPRLQLLNGEQMNEVHQYSIRILEDTGLEVESKDALKIFDKSDAVNIRNDEVYIKGELINPIFNQWAIRLLLKRKEKSGSG